MTKLFKELLRHQIIERLTILKLDMFEIDLQNQSDFKFMNNHRLNDDYTVTFITDSKLDNLLNVWRDLKDE